MATNKSVLKGIVFFGVAPLLAILGGMLWSDFFAIDTAEHPAKWEYTVGPILFFAGLGIFILTLVLYAGKDRKA